MGISKSGCSVSITKEDLKRKYEQGFVDGLMAACTLILEELQDQRFDILDEKTENYEVALATVDKSIKSVEDRLNHYKQKLKRGE